MRGLHSVRQAFSRSLASLLAVIMLLVPTGAHAAPAEVFSSPAPAAGASPPKAAELRAGEGSVSTQTGAFSYSYPISVPPGRSGMQPHLSLDYSSQAPIYGTIASGWSLSIPAILEDLSQGALRTHSPLDDYDQLPGDQVANDRYVSTMAGNRPLIPVDEPSGSDVAQAYRVADDGTFTRYQRMNIGTGYSWRALTTGGVTLRFGEADHTGECPQIDYGNAPLTSEEDVFGNRVEYFYEWRGTDIQDCVISRITWGMNANIAIHLPFAQVAFDWTSPTMSEADYAAGSTRSYRTGKLRVHGASKLASITVTALSPFSEAAPVHTRLITLAYEGAAEKNSSADPVTDPVTHAPLRLLKSIQESAWGTDAPRVNLPSVEFGYAPLTVDLENATGAASDISPWTSDWHSSNLAWGYRRPDHAEQWPTVEAMLVDMNGDGLLDRLWSSPVVNSTGDVTECHATWQENKGPKKDHPLELDFGDSHEIDLPRLKWGDPAKIVGSSLAHATGEQGCSLNGQASSYYNSHGTPNICHDDNACVESEDPAKAGRYFCYPGGTRCPLDPGSGGLGGDYLTYLSYRWLDVDGDGLTDLVAAVHGDIDTYDIEQGNDTAFAEFSSSTGPFGTPWPACPGTELCADLGSCVQEHAGTHICEGSECPPEYWAAVHDCLAEDHPQLECFDITGRMSSVDDDEPSQRSPYTRCEGLYPWFIWKNQGNATFLAHPTIKYEPVPLESEQGDSALISPVVAAEDHAVMDFDGDGWIDGIARGKWSVSNPNPNAWYVWLGDGDGGMGPKRYYFPSRTTTGDKNRISGADGVANSAGDPVGQIIGTEDLNGDGLPDHWIDNGDATSTSGGTANIAFNDGVKFEVSGSGLVGGTNTPSTTDGIIPASKLEIASSPTPSWSSSVLQHGVSVTTKRLMDVDNDGRPDLVVLPETGSATVYYNVGGQFLRVGYPFPGDEDGARRRTLGQQTSAYSGIFAPWETYYWELNSDVLDLDGDGIAEGVHASVDGHFKRSISAGPQRLLTSIGNNRGGKSFITYASMHDTATVKQSPSETWPDGRPKSTPVEQWVVKSIRSEDLFDDFADGTGATTSYFYENPRHSKDDQGHYAFRGFEQVTTTAQSGADTIQRYSYDPDWSGRLETTIVQRAPSERGAVTDEVHSIAHTTWEKKTLFSGAIETFQATQTDSYTCANGKTEAECLSCPAAHTRTITTLGAMAVGGVARLWTAIQTMLQDLSAPGLDRRTTNEFELVADATNYRLQPLSTVAEHQDGSGFVMYAKTTHAWDGDFLTPLSDAAYVDDVPSNALVTHRTYDEGGNVLTITNPRGYTTTYTYDARDLFVATEDRPGIGADLDYEYEYGTGAKLNTIGPQLAWCSVYPPYVCPAGSLVRNETKTKVDGLGRPIELWESMNESSGAYAFELKKTGTTQYKDDILDTQPTSVTRQSVLSEDGSTTRWTKQVVTADGHGRPLETQQKIDDDGTMATLSSYHYNLDGTLGSVVMQSPKDDTHTVAYTYGFDSLGRMTTVRRPDATSPADRSGADTSYDGVTVTSTEVVGAAGGTPAKSRRTTDAFGRLLTVEEKLDETPTGETFATTTYEYGPDDNVAVIHDAEAHTTSLAHDFAGRRTSITRGTRVWSYLYDEDGNVWSETTPCESTDLGCPADFTTTIAYDQLDRPISRSIAPRHLSSTDRALFGSDSEVIQWDYGPNTQGRMTSWSAFGPGTSTETVGQQFAFDPRGQPTWTFDSFKAAGYDASRDVTHAYYLGGQLWKTGYRDLVGASGEFTLAWYDYDARGLPADVWISGDRGVSWPHSPTVNTRNLAGLVTKQRTQDLTGSISFVESNWTYDELGRVKSQVAQKSGPTQIVRQDLEYLGNDDPSTLTQWLGSDEKQFHYTFDRRHQLKEVSESEYPNAFSATYDYGAAGRFTHATEAAATLAKSDVVPRDVDYIYGGDDPELVTSLVSTTSTVATYEWDLAGNMTSRTYPATGEHWDFLYDGKDQLRRATKSVSSSVVGIEEYWYDSSGNRTQVVKRDASASPTELVWTLEDTESHFAPSGTVTRTFANVSLGNTVARVDRTSDSSVLVEYQFHGLGNSTIGAVDELTGTVNTSMTYAPFGEVITATDAGSSASAGIDDHKRRLNDKQQDDLTGLAYYGARYYDKRLMGWTQVDPLYLRAPDLGKQSTPRRSNLGAFSLNNPLRYLDPDGRDSVGRTSHWTDEFNAAQASRVAEAGGDDSTHSIDVHAAEVWDRWHFWDGSSSGEGRGGLTSENACDGVHGVCEEDATSGSVVDAGKRAGARLFQGYLDGYSREMKDIRTFFKRDTANAIAFGLGIGGSTWIALELRSVVAASSGAAFFATPFIDVFSPATMTALVGGRHAGTLVKLLNSSDEEIESSIESWTEKLSQHLGWIASPITKIADFASRDPRYQVGVVGHWQVEVSNFRAQIDIARDVLKWR